MKEILFKEEQVPEGAISGKFWKFSITVSVIVSALFGIALLLQLALNIKIGNSLMSNSALLITGLLLWIFVYYLLKLKMITTVFDDYLIINFTGILFTRKIAFSSIQKLERLKFSDLSSYSGYGIHYSPHMGWGFSLNDSEGVLIYLIGKSRPVLIGSLRTEQLYYVLKQQVQN